MASKEGNGTRKRGVHGKIPRIPQRQGGVVKPHTVLVGISNFITPKSLKVFFFYYIRTLILGEWDG
jgi:hypothetical protein